MPKRDLIGMLDLEHDLDAVLDLCAAIKAGKERPDEFVGRTLAMIFEKPSTRTRVSFEVAAYQLGGCALYLSPKDIQMGRGETVEDTARVLSRYCDMIMYRAFSNDMMRALAGAATVPVINGLDDVEHPCQAVADLLTIREHKGRLNGLTMAYVGDGNNVCHSLLLAGALAGMHVRAVTPERYRPSGEVVERARRAAEATGGSVTLATDPVEGVSGADIVYTDVWVSMGDEAEKAVRESVFPPYQINAALMANAPNAIFMHCLPAHRGVEVTDEIVDGPQSVVFDQAENRLHAQKGIMVWLMRGSG